MLDKEIHDYLLSLGFTYGENIKANFSGLTWNSVFNHDKLSIYRDTYDSDWRVRWHKDNYLDIIDITLDDIKPILEKHGITPIVKDEFEPITKDNIRQTLVFNNIVSLPSDSSDWLCIPRDNIRCGLCLSLEYCNNWLEIIELVTDKLTPLPKKQLFRKHWKLSTGEVIYADEVPISADKKYWLYDWLYDTRLILQKIGDVNTYVPRQYENKESDFGILLENGDYIRAIWHGGEV